MQAGLRKRLHDLPSKQNWVLGWGFRVRNEYIYIYVYVYIRVQVRITHRYIRVQGPGGFKGLGFKGLGFQAFTGYIYMYI